MSEQCRVMALISITSSGHTTLKPNGAVQGDYLEVVATEDDLAIAAVELTNAAFYAAHEARDIDAMASVWEHSPRAICVHPGWPILRGWPAVEDSWRRIFEGPGQSQFILTNEEVMVDGDMAWITLDENLVDGARTSTVAATNVFVRTSTGWLLTVHHGSPVMAPPS